VRRLALALAMLVVPAAAEACASCISSPFGDQSYNWPYLVLILVPFAAAAVIAGVMMRVTGARFSDLRPWLTRVLHPAPQEETK
jgi:peptidoglycan/LPS O-acetylase OafA/YrhL